MKELTTEQKAKAYDEAKLRMSAAYNSNRCTIGFMNEIFPELAESEDERIRKDLIKFIEGCGAYSQEYIDWLEKQGKQNNNEDEAILHRFSFYSYKDEPNILYLSGLYVNEECRNEGIGTKILKIADEVAVSMKCSSILLKTEIGSNAERLYKNNGYSIFRREENQVWLKKQGEQNPYNVEPKFKPGDTIREKETDNLFYVNSIEDFGYILHYSNCPTKGCTMSFKYEDDYELVEQKPADKVEPFDRYEGLTDFERTLANICIGWIGEELGWKEYIKNNADVLLKIAIEKFNSVQDASFEQNPAEWSKEDEKFLNEVITNYESGYLPSCAERDEIVERLKSIKFRNTWKPSEGQLECLGYAIERTKKDFSPLTNNRVYLTLKALKEQLEKLRGSKV